MKNVVPFSFDSLQVRVVMQGDEPWFVAVDVCAALELDQVSRAVSRLDDDEVQVIDFATLTNSTGVINQRLNPNQPINIINESGLYSLILTSRKPEAKQFKKWVTSEVLPSIRKTGSYVHPQSSSYTDAVERMTTADMANLTRLVWCCSHFFQYKGAFVYAIWARLRAVTGTASPQRFAVQDIPILAAEIRRIFSITSDLTDRIIEAEKAVVRRVFRKNENAAKVLREVEFNLNASFNENAWLFDSTLEKWGELAISRFVERIPPTSNAWQCSAEFEEPLALHQR